MRLLVLVTGEYGYRHVKNIRDHGPSHWEVSVWQTPRTLPLVIDYPEDYCPDDLPSSDLILSLAELKGVAELIPEIAQNVECKAVIAPIDNIAWLPVGLANQLKNWLARIDVACVTPKPFCSLTESSYNVHRFRENHNHPLIREFAGHFGKPQFEMTVSPDKQTIEEAMVKRDACCGCARYVAAKLSGTPIDEAIEASGLHHHHYPCQASMGIDAQLNDTLMHISGNILKDAVKDALDPYLSTRYIRPPGHVDEDS